MNRSPHSTSLSWLPSLAPHILKAGSVQDWDVRNKRVFNERTTEISGFSLTLGFVSNSPLEKTFKSICFRSTASDPSVSPENQRECNFRIPDLFTQTTDYEHLMSEAKDTHLSTATISDCKRTSWWLRGKPLQGVQLHFSIPDSGTEIQAELSRKQHKKSDSEPPLHPVVCRKGWGMQSKYCYYRCQPKTTYTFNKAS